MNYQDLIKEKHSVREYKSKKIDSKIINEVNNFMSVSKSLVSDIKTRFEFVENNGVSKKLNGICGYKGIMIDAPHYVLVYSEKKPYYIENGGYLGELASLKLFERGLDSCFITFSDGSKVTEILGIETDLELVALLGFGYGKKSKSIFGFTKTGGNYSKAKFGLDDNTKEKYKLTELVYDGKWGVEASYDMLANRMLEMPLFYSRLAPSSYNRQPWKFILDNDRIILAMEKGNSSYNDAVDAGIQMLYFDLVIAETLMEITWVMGETEGDYGVPDTHEIVAFARI